MRHKTKDLEIFSFSINPKLNLGYGRRETKKLSYNYKRSPAVDFFSFTEI
jgi:hypothetical protein